MNPLAEVLARSDVWRGGLAAAPLPVQPSGFAELDAELPGGGWPRGGLTELLFDGVGLGELALLAPALRAANGWTLLIHPPAPLHAPAWRGAGVDLGRLWVVAPDTEAEALWAMEQALGAAALNGGESGMVALCWSARADARAVRRLQVAAAGGGALAFLCRPASAAAETSAAVLRLRLAADPDGRLAVTLHKRRGPPRAGPVYLQVGRPAAVRAGEGGRMRGDGARLQVVRPGATGFDAGRARPVGRPYGLPVGVFGDAEIA